VTWNTPHGGFFTVVTVPFSVGDQELEQCAEDFGVLWTPMSHFYDNGGGCHQLRLSYSSVPPDQIEPALHRLRRFVSAKLKSSTHNR
jgi:(S)-3,5-dihydroxyphenylglycine transaminase